MTNIRTDFPHSERSHLVANSSAVIVTYNPHIEILDRLISAISRQVGRVIIVDNASQEDDLSRWVSHRHPVAHFLRLNANYGIARAQNVGIDMARVDGSDYVVLLDQDSFPAPDMVFRLVEAAETKRSEGVKVAAVGPRYEDARQMNPIPFIKVQGLRLKRANCPSPTAIVNVDYLIASGCLIPLETLNAVGGMREDLFIDYVDIEWGLRAQKNGYHSFGACGARMSHELGDEPVYFRKRYIPVHSPLRHYYHFRNAVWLYRQPWPRRNWKIVDSLRLVRKFVFYSLMTPPRLKHAGMMTLGIVHGLAGRLGKKQ